MSENLMRQLQLLPDYLGSHLLITITALSLGIIVCLPTAIAVTRIKKLRWPVLSFASVMQTIPGIALLALMVPLLGQIGFVPALVALFLYSMLPILRNTVTGISEVDPSLIEAARGLGMTSNQMLWKVELPVALPIIIAGIRTSTVWVVGTATLSTAVGAKSLGNYIFSGLHIQNHTSVLVGCIAAALLAMILDSLIRLSEIAVTQRNAFKGGLAAMGLIIVLFGGLSSYAFKFNSAESKPIISIGAKTFTEQYILSDLMATMLKDDGFNIDTRSSMGSTILFDALKNGEVDCYIDYSGTIWANHMKRSDTKSADIVLQEMTDWLKEKHGVLCLGALGFENTYALAVKKGLAKSLELESIADLSKHSPNLLIGSDYEFFSRPEWFAIRDNYNLNFYETVSMDHALMYAAIDANRIDVVTAYSTDGRIAAHDLVILKDPKQALPPYDAVLLLSPEAAENQKLIKALMPIIGSMSNQLMQQANMMVDIDKAPTEKAANYLAENIME